MTSRRWLWRWRRNPLRRRLDRVEAWTLLAAVVLFTAGVPAVGATAASAYHDHLQDERRARQPVQAVLVEDAEPLFTRSALTGGLAGGGDGLIRTKVRWTDDDGTVHTGGARVPARLDVGATARIWTADGGSRVVPAPPTTQQVVGATTAGVSVAGVFAALSLAALRGVRVHFDRRREELWEQEWARVGPRWGHRTA
ncbi:hypothetical protein O7599_05185 [Streptomyces sp. WMMC500]|uniref:Rv1733c family protein n=1 Tax=Streptomyces sp. WMMC500 TaxID=3015154 RepID=UPI00248BEEED|nr:hypothetical protein [Streptomyces sp. WMMC500]WBB61943.1 hypothetical protein O7599_05185 [Streptomyces sp. WMMC500]